jgi:hypothetical protein
MLNIVEERGDERGVYVVEGKPRRLLAKALAGE